MFFIVSGAITLGSVLTLTLMANRAPEAYETERGLHVIRRLSKAHHRATARFTDAVAQAQ